MGSAFRILVPKHDTVDSNNHCRYGHKATGTFTFLKVTFDDIKIAQQSL